MAVVHSNLFRSCVPQPMHSSLAEQRWFLCLPVFLDFSAVIHLCGARVFAASSLGPRACILQAFLLAPILIQFSKLVNRLALLSMQGQTGLQPQV